MQTRNERSRTKLIATLGPSTDDRDVLRRMFLEGIDVCRLNFSHGSREEHARRISMVREINGELGANVAILADLQGPKIRVGEIQGGSVMLYEGADLDLLTGNFAGNSREVPVNYDYLPEDVKPGDRILMDDGRIELSVVDSDGRDRVTTKIIHGGNLGSRKGVNLPSSRLSVPSLTEKDREDAVFAVEQGVDWIALSFVRAAGDITDLRELVESSGGSAGLIAKIEKPQALDDIDRIIDTADAVMVARGDLGVEVEFHKVPMIQKMIVRKCLRAATPVIIATQMMESMIDSYRPTRAEAADVANAVLDGADTLMLSGETAVGRYPDLVIRNMQRIIDWTEEHEGLRPLGPSPHTGGSGSFPDSICYSAVQMAGQAGARAIVTFTHSGYTAVRISSHRPEADIFAFTMNRQLLPMLSLVWGVKAFYLESSGQIEDYTDRSMGFLRERGLAGPGDTVVHVGSIPLQEHGKTNMLKLSRIPSGSVQD
ncbi:MAG: pyruvate kinase [Candidatus Fermentibacteraceae bacterium]|nr:pyruvate kinase [Candidatus Fermentibacteraceae bacterium]MBN2608374.1 pyruvate kinase [Candidatus Fermentibacteraceae bacterium]